MKILSTILLSLVAITGWSQQRVVPSTAYTRYLLRSPTAPVARDRLGITDAIASIIAGENITVVTNGPNSWTISSGGYGASPYVPPTGGADWGWWKADDIVASDGDALAQWDDSSGNGHHMTQVTNSVRPVYKTSRIGALPAVRFASTWFDLPRFYSAFSEGELFIVVRGDLDPDTDPTSRHHGWMNLSSELAYDLFNVEDIRRPFVGFGSSAHHGIGTNLPYGTFSNWNVFNFSAEADNWVARVNGVEEFTDTDNMVAWPAVNQSVIGKSRPYDAFDEYFYGDIAEVIFYGEVLTSLQRSQVEVYLQNKYGLVTDAAVAGDSLTNSAASLAPDFALDDNGKTRYSLLQTNAAFAFLAPMGVDATLAQTSVIFVTNSTAAAVAFSAPANCRTVGTLFVTNLTACTFFQYGGRFTNLTSLPLW